MKKWLVVMMSGLMLLGIGGIATAGPLDPTLDAAEFSDGLAAGQGSAVNVTCGTTAGTCGLQTVDWIVRQVAGAPGGPGIYQYFYQLEDHSSTELNNFTIGGLITPLSPGNYTAFGDLGLAGGDFDVNGNPTLLPGHNSTNFANLATEFEIGGLDCTPCIFSTSSAAGSTNITFTYAGAGVIVGKETTTVFIVGGAPIYGQWRTQDGTSWDSEGG